MTILAVVQIRMSPRGLLCGPFYIYRKLKLDHLESSKKSKLQKQRILHIQPMSEYHFWTFSIGQTIFLITNSDSTLNFGPFYIYRKLKLDHLELYKNQNEKIAFSILPVRYRKSNFFDIFYRSDSLSDQKFGFYGKFQPDLYI